MDIETFREECKKLGDLCDSILLDRGPEYTERNPDRLNNFNSTAKKLGITPQQVAFVFLNKHFASIAQFCAGQYKGDEPIQGRIADAINYLRLLNAINHDNQDKDIWVTETGAIVVK